MRVMVTLLRTLLTLFQNEVAARGEILSFFDSHVRALNDIFSRTEFKPLSGGSPCFKGVQFQIQRTTVRLLSLNLPSVSLKCLNKKKGGGGHQLIILYDS